MLEDLNAASGDDIAVTLSDEDIDVSVYDDDIDVYVDGSFSINGRGVIPGGFTGQFLAKASNIDYDMEWKDQIIGVPIDGLLGQVLTKMGPEPYNTAWQNVPNPLPVGGPTGYILSKVSNSNFDVAWVPPVNTALFVAKAGDTMGGMLSLFADPTLPMHAATMQYVDTKAPILSPELQGVPTAPIPAVGAPANQIATVGAVQAIAGSYLPLIGGALSGFLSLHANPTDPAHAANKAYVDTKAPLASPVFTGTPTAPTPAAGDVSGLIATTAFVATKIGAYLPLIGGTLSGVLNMGTQNIINLGAPSQPHHAARRADVDVKADIASPLFTGIPRAPLQLTTDSSDRLATTQFVKNVVAAYLPLIGGALSGFLTLHSAPTLPMHAATRQYVDTAASSLMPKAGGAFTGAVTVLAPVGDMEPATKLMVDLKAPIDSPAFTGIPTAPNPTTGDDSQQIATTHFVQAIVTGGVTSYLPLAGGTMTGPGELVLFANPTNALGAATKQYVDLKANIASPAFTGAPTAPSPADNSVPDRLATTGYVTSSITAATSGLYLPLAGGTLSGALAVTAGNLVVSGGQIQIDRTGDVADADLYLIVDAGRSALIRWRTGTAHRWFIGKNNAAESGADAGSNFRIGAYTDAGVVNDVIVIDRASRVTNFLTGPTAPTAAPLTSTTQLATTQFVTLATAFYLPLAGGTLSNFLTLHANPTSAMHAATMAYVDAADANALLKDGSRAMTGPLTLSGLPSDPAHATNKAYVDAADVLKANLASPTFSGSPQAPTPATNDNSQLIATTAFVRSNLGLYLPLAGGVDVTGPFKIVAPSDDMHPTTRLYVDTGLLSKANIASPAFTGTPTAPLPDGSIVGQIATVQYVSSRVGAYLPLVGGTLTGTLTGTSVIATGANAFRVNRVGQAADADIFIDVDAGRSSSLTFRTGVTRRWAFNKQANAEAGADAGSPLVLTAYGDAGNNLGDVFSITRATRVLNFPVNPTYNGTVLSAGDSSTKLATSQFVTTADNLKLNLTGGTLSGNLIQGNGYIQINRFGDAADAFFYINADAGFNSIFHFYTGNATNRWRFGKNGVAETGGSAGSEFFLASYDDSNNLTNVFLIKRSDRIVAFTATPTAPTMAPGNSSLSLATTAFVAAAVAGATTGGVPAGGTTNQVLAKNSNADRDLKWADPAGVGTFLALAGGTMTGTLTLAPASQTAANDAATRSYAESLVVGLAPLANPVFTGDPRAPNVTWPNNTTSIANTAFVTSAINSLAIGNYLLRDGTQPMTGVLTLAVTPPSSGQHATNKTYVDTQDALALLKTGGVMSGEITLPDGSIATSKTYVDARDLLALPKTGGAMSGNINMNGSMITGLPTADLSVYDQGHHVVPKLYVDTKAPITDAHLLGDPTAPTQPDNSVPTRIATTGYVANVTGNFLLKAGGTMTGPINMGGHAITGLGNPAGPDNAVNKSTMDTALLSKASLDSPVFINTPTTPTPGGSIPLQIVNVAYLNTATNLLMPKSGGAFSGDVTVLTPAGAMNPATRQYVDDGLLAKANANNANLTGVPHATIPTDNSDPARIATTGYVASAVSGAGAFLPITGGTLTGKLTLDPVDQTAANDAAYIGYVNAQDALKASLTGAAFTGNISAKNLTLSRLTEAANVGLLMLADVGSTAYITLGSTSGQQRWRFGKGPGAEGAGNTNSDFIMTAFDNAGGSIGDVFTIVRGTRVMSFTVSPTAPTPVDNSVPTRVATTGYVNAAIAGGGAFLPITGGTLTGPLYLTGPAITANQAASKGEVALKADLAGPTFTGIPKVDASPVDNSTPTRLATTGYVQAVAVSQLTNYLLKTGGSVTGDINMSNTGNIIGLPLTPNPPAQNHHALAYGIAESRYAHKDNAELTGNPTAVTQATGNVSTRLATTEFVNNKIIADVSTTYIPKAGASGIGELTLLADPLVTNPLGVATRQMVALKANNADPVFTGNPSRSTAISTGDSSENLATTRFVTTKLGDYLLKNAAVLGNQMNAGGFKIIGLDISNYATYTQDHHAIPKGFADQKYAPIVSPALTGAPTAPNASTSGASRIATIVDVTSQAPNYVQKIGDTGVGPIFFTGPIPYDTNNIYMAVHKHYVFTNFAPIISPVLTGNPRAPNTLDADPDDTIATKGYVDHHASPSPVVANRTAMKETPASTHPILFLQEDGREGWFEFTPATPPSALSTFLTTACGTDTREAVYIAPAGQNGSNGAWIRVGVSELLPRWFGATPTTDEVPIAPSGSTQHSTTVDNTVAFQAMMQLAKIMNWMPIRIDANYYIGPLLVPGPIVMRGNGYSTSTAVDTMPGLYFDYPGHAICFDLDGRSDPFAAGSSPYCVSTRGMLFEDFRLIGRYDNGVNATDGNPSAIPPIAPRAAVPPVWLHTAFSTKKTDANTNITWRRLAIRDFGLAGIVLYDSYSNVITDCVIAECGHASNNGACIILEASSWGAPHDLVNLTASTGNEIRGNYLGGFSCYGVRGSADSRNWVMFQRFVENKYEENAIRGIEMSCRTKGITLETEYLEANYGTYAAGARFTNGDVTISNCNESGNIPDDSYTADANHIVVESGIYIEHNFAEWKIGVGNSDDAGTAGAKNELLAIDLSGSDMGVSRIKMRNGHVVLSSGISTPSSQSIEAIQGSLCMMKSATTPLWVKTSDTTSLGWKAVALQP